MGRLVRRLLALTAVSNVLGGCLVVSDPDFRGQDECVPFFLAHEADPSTPGPHLRPESATDPAEFRATVPMRSCALTRDYRAHVFVDNTLRVIQRIPPTGNELRDVSILVNIGEESPGCHRVSVYVSTNFADFTTPDRPGDVAKIDWLFYNDQNSTAAGCGSTP